MKKKRLNNLLRELEFFLNNSPVEEDCSDKENEMYSDMANLKNSIIEVFEEEK